MVGLTSSVFREIVKRMQAFGLVNLQIENNKITDNIFLQLHVFDDELISGFLKKPEAQKIAQRYEHLKEQWDH